MRMTHLQRFFSTRTSKRNRAQRTSDSSSKFSRLEPLTSQYMNFLVTVEEHIFSRAIKKENHNLFSMKWKRSKQQLTLQKVIRWNYIQQIPTLRTKSAINVKRKLIKQTSISVSKITNFGIKIVRMKMTNKQQRKRYKKQSQSILPSVTTSWFFKVLNPTWFRPSLRRLMATRLRCSPQRETKA